MFTILYLAPAASKGGDPAGLRQNVLSRQDSLNRRQDSKTVKLQRTGSSSSVVSRSNSLKDVTRKEVVRRDSGRRVTGMKGEGSSQVGVRRTGSSRRDESPAARVSRLGLKNASPNTSNVSLKAGACSNTKTSAGGVSSKRVTRTDSLRNNKSNPASRSSSFSRAGVSSRPAVTNVSTGHSTLPRDVGGHRSRSQGDYVTVLEIGGSTNNRSKSASVSRPLVSRSASREGLLSRSASRSNSLKRVMGSSDQGAGTVSVHIRHGHDTQEPRHEARPARKQSIKIGASSKR